MGVYPVITLVKARQKREELRDLIANGININDLKKQNKMKTKIVETKKENTFYNVSQKWHENYKSEVSENYVYPFIKEQSIEL